MAGICDSVLGNGGGRDVVRKCNCCGAGSCPSRNARVSHSGVLHIHFTRSSWAFDGLIANQQFPHSLVGWNFDEHI